MPENAQNGTTGKPRSLMSNWVSYIGLVIAAIGFFAAAMLVSMGIIHGYSNPYFGILSYLIAPAILVGGLIVFAIGLLIEHHRRRSLAPHEVPRYPRIDFNIPHQRHTFAVVTVIGVILLLFTAVGSYRAYQFTDSVQFCGKTCHSIMTPEYTAYKESPHARVECVQCHIGPGATWFVRSKLSGVGQVFATIFNTYPRPIPTPVKNLRPAQQTCEQCHWPRKFYGAVERTFTHYLPDSANTPWTIRMLVDIGGGDPSFGPVGGIHWHMNIANKVEYIARDSARQDIPWVRITDEKGHSTVYQSTDDPLTKAQIDSATPRVMDCIDCHNRPTHIYNSPVHSLNLAMSTGRVSPSIPMIKREGVFALEGNYPTTDSAMTGISDTLHAYYRTHFTAYADSNAATIDSAIAEVQNIYRHNFFPAMKVSWKVYPDNIGHKDFIGCYRCHDGNHVSASGKTITHNCKACHEIIAQGPGTKLTTLSADGLEFQHPVDIGGAWQFEMCTDCHNGGLGALAME